MTSQRLAGQIAVVAALLHTTAFSTPLERSASDDGWNTARATVVAGTTATPTRIALARGMALREGVSLADGTIEADLDAPRASQFAGLAFRAANTADYEIVYFRGDAGRWQEVQYQPVFDGEPTWQLYWGPGYNADLPADLAPQDAPLHVKIVFAGTRADVYVNHASQPVLRVPELKHAPQAGQVGVWVAGDRTAQTVFAGYAAESRVDATLEPLAQRPPRPGQIMSWRVSARLASPDTIAGPVALSVEHRQALSAGKEARAESDGLLNLSRVVGNPAGPQVVNVLGGAGWGLALASATLTATHAHTARLRLGYSEGIGVFLNGRRVFTGTNPYASPNLGRVAADASTVDLPLRRGANELVLAVTDRAFGWGFLARIDGDGDVVASVPEP
jgi:hypothetical protein